MTLVQLKHLIALAESGSFSRSAEVLCLTQPALSRSIRALEDELGQSLFDRLGRHSELTPFGREVLARARQVVLDADELLDSGRRMGAGEAGVLRIGLGSGPGAMLMTPLLMTVAERHPGLHVDISRATTALLVQALRERLLDALIVDARSLVPAPDLCLDTVSEMRGAFMCRHGHPLAEQGAHTGRVTFAEVQRFPIASTPLSDEVARVLMERYGPQAHPAQCVTLRCEEIPSLVEVARCSDAVLIAIRAAGPQLAELPMQPPLAASARFGLVTLAGRTPAPGLAIVRERMQATLRDAGPILRV
ncbi:LysR family transcriptional regulator [Sphaerotilus sp.]|uniref:LysR family transcriptional regulator n=1 Tax=Sphaerotilus sp. TaxID=2093942 RepID=UPI0034E24773